MADLSLALPDGSALPGPLPSVRLSDGRLAVLADAAAGLAGLPDRVLVDGVPHDATLVRSGRAHAEATARLQRARSGWWPRRRRPGPVLLLEAVDEG